MALTKAEYCTLARVKDGLGITGTDEDAALEFCITAASRFMDTYCQREFWYEEAQSDDVRSGGMPYLVLPRAPVWGVTSVTRISSDVALSLTDILIRENSGVVHFSSPLQARVWRHGGIDQPPAWGFEVPDFRVVYSAGWTTPEQTPVSGVDSLPENLQMACSMLATNMYYALGQDLRVRRLHVLEAAAWYHEGGITTGVEMVLNGYRKIV